MRQSVAPFVARCGVQGANVTPLEDALSDGGLSVFCTTCGTANSDEARFCNTCGSAIATQPGPAVLVPRNAPSPRVPDAAPLPPSMAPSASAPSPPAHYAPQTHVHVNQQVQVAPAAAVMFGAPKSVALALVLTFFFGPFGLFYASVTGGFVMLFGGIFITIATSGVAGVLVWLGSMVWAGIAANNHNAALAVSRQIYVQNNRPY